MLPILIAAGAKHVYDTHKKSKKRRASASNELRRRAETRASWSDELGEGDNYWERGISHHDEGMYLENQFGTYRPRTDEELGVKLANEREQFRRQEYFKKKENNIDDISHWQRFADAYYEGDLHKAMMLYKRDLQANMMTFSGPFGNSKKGKEIRKKLQPELDFVKKYETSEITLNKVTINPGDEKGLRAKQKALEMFESFSGIESPERVEKLKTFHEARAFAEGVRNRYKKVSNKIFGEEIMKLDKGGFKKLEDFALSSGKQYVKEGMGNLRDRMAGKTDRDTGKGARKALADIVRDRKSGIGSSATAKSSMEKELRRLLLLMQIHRQ